MGSRRNRRNNRLRLEEADDNEENEGKYHRKITVKNEEELMKG